MGLTELLSVCERVNKITQEESRAIIVGRSLGFIHRFELHKHCYGLDMSWDRFCTEKLENLSSEISYRYMKLADIHDSVELVDCIVKPKVLTYNDSFAGLKVPQAVELWLILVHMVAVSLSITGQVV